MTEQCTAGCALNGNTAGLTYRAQQWTNNWGQAYNPRASLAYITGAHSMKFGYHGFFGLDRNSFTNTTNLSYRVNNGVPNQLTMYGDPIVRLPRVTQTSVYAQEQWTHGRLTLQGALRYDRAASHFLAQQAGPTRFIPDPIVFPRQEGIDGYQDITPRAGVAYDVFGNGKTALKFNVGKYLAAASVSGIYINTNPVLLISTSVTRSWIDANSDWVPDCNLVNPVAQDLRTAGGDLCGAMSNQNFGKPVFSNTYDPAVREGWGIRPSNWNFGISVQHELLPRVSAEVGYFRRRDDNFIVTDNRAVTAADFNQFCVTAPGDTRLPGGGGAPICGLYDVSPTRFGQVDNFVTLASNYGNQTQVPGRGSMSRSTPALGRI